MASKIFFGLVSQQNIDHDHDRVVCLDMADVATGAQCQAIQQYMAIVFSNSLCLILVRIRFLVNKVLVLTIGFASLDDCQRRQ